MANEASSKCWQTKWKSFCRIGCTGNLCNEELTLEGGSGGSGGSGGGGGSGGDATTITGRFKMHLISYGELRYWKYLSPLFWRPVLKNFLPMGENSFI